MLWQQLAQCCPMFVVLLPVLLALFAAVLANIRSMLSILTNIIGEICRLCR